MQLIGQFCPQSHFLCKPKSTIGSPIQPTTNLALTHNSKNYSLVLVTPKTSDSVSGHAGIFKRLVQLLLYPNRLVYTPMGGTALLSLTHPTDPCHTYAEECCHLFSLACSSPDFHAYQLDLQPNRGVPTVSLLGPF